LRSHQNRTGAEVGLARETRRRNLRRISQTKSERVRGTWIPTTSLVTSYSSMLFVQHPVCQILPPFSGELPDSSNRTFLAETASSVRQRVLKHPILGPVRTGFHSMVEGFVEPKEEPDGNCRPASRIWRQIILRSRICAIPVRRFDEFGGARLPVLPIPPTLQNL
jgi:hypothetical protein